MLTSTFRHLRGISSNKEAHLWRSGVLSWDDYDAKSIVQHSLFPDQNQIENSPLNASRRALQEKDLDFFSRALDRQQHFRIALTYPADTLFLDIETTGLSWYYDKITVVGWSTAGKFDFLVAGEPPEKLYSAMAKAKVIVTFNGTMFDLPFLRRTYPDLHIPHIHVDLRFLAKRVGLTGGQKEIEQILKLHRGEDIAQVMGEMAPILWHRYVRGDVESLRLLIQYNRADVWGMERIFDKVVDRLIKKEELPQQLKKTIHRFRPHTKTTKKIDEELFEKIQKVLPLLPRQAAKPALHITDLWHKQKLSDLRVVGIDLTGSEARASGWCLLAGKNAETRSIFTDDEIVQGTIATKPQLISIDSPLSLPPGRKTVFDDDPGREEYGIVRPCERILKKRGVNVYPALIPSMQRLTARGIRLAQKFRSLGYPVIESYPGAAQDIMNIPRKHAGLAFLEEGLSAFGVMGDFTNIKVSHDELDAITSAVVGVFFWAGRFEGLGEGGEEALVIPDLNTDPSFWLNQLVVVISGSSELEISTMAHDLQNRWGLLHVNLDGKSAEPTNLPEIENEGVTIQKRRDQVRSCLLGAKAASKIIIDGVKSLGDLALLYELFGPAITHVSVNPPTKQANTAKKTGVHEIHTLADVHLTKIEDLFPVIDNLVKQVI